jgi:hypothetical protein
MTVIRIFVKKNVIVMGEGKIKFQFLGGLYASV